MPQFDKNCIKELKEFLYYSCCHDAKIECIEYEQKEHSLKVKAVNQFYNIEIDLMFNYVNIFFAITGDALGDSKTIASLTVEDDLSYLRNYIQQPSDSFKDSLYVLLQTLSGDELHIISKNVFIDKKTGNGSLS